MPADEGEHGVFFTAGHKLVVVTEDDYLAHLAADVHRFGWMGSLPYQVPQTKYPLNAALFDIFEDGFQCGQVAVYVGYYGDFFHDGYILQDRVAAGKENNNGCRRK